VSLYWKLETDFWTKSLEGGTCAKTMTETALLATQGRWRTHNCTIFKKNLSRCCKVEFVQPPSSSPSVSVGILLSCSYQSLVVYYESIKRELKIKPISECRCDERLQTKTKRFTHLSYTGLVVELEHLKIKTRLTNEKFASVKGECEI
jgi:hypothetical protein